MAAQPTVLHRMRAPRPRAHVVRHSAPALLEGPGSGRGAASARFLTFAAREHASRRGKHQSLELATDKSSRIGSKGLPHRALAFARGAMQTYTEARHSCEGSCAHT